MIPIYESHMRTMVLEYESLHLPSVVGQYSSTMEHMRMDDLGVSPFMETPLWTSSQLHKGFPGISLLHQASVCISRIGARRVLAPEG